MNSCGSRTSFCISSSCRSQWKYCSSGWAAVRPSLYFQWAAMPSSAMLCISRVRICTSNGMPTSLTTEVCSDWYPFGRGIAMKSLNRPGTGAHI